MHMYIHILYCYHIVHIPCSLLIFSADVRLDQSFVTGDNFAPQGTLSNV